MVYDGERRIVQLTLELQKQALNRLEVNTM